MRILLDTFYLYRLMTGYGRFRDPERRFFDQNAAELHVSAVSIWEMRLKYNSRRASGERKSPFDPNDVLATLEGLGIALLTITPHHSARELATPIPHSDPFDELLLVQAQEEDLRLLTTDRQLIDHPLSVTP